jgi:ribosomal protein S7
MKLCKSSTAFNRVFNKFYVFDYQNALYKLLIKKGYKLRAYKLIDLFFFHLKSLYKDFNYIISIFEKYVPVINFYKKKIATTQYFLPIFINENKARFLLIRWFLQAVSERSELLFLDRLIGEFVDMEKGYGKLVRKVEEYYLLALKNRPFFKFLRKRKKVFLSRKKKYGL